jgi:hypothetical protein
MTMAAPSRSFLSNARFMVDMPAAISALSTVVDSTTLGFGYKPREFDVVCGRGKGSYNRPGNLHMRRIVRTYIDEYLAAKSKLDKSIVLNKVLEEVRSQGDGSAMLVKQNKDGSWMEIGDDQAREKIGHAIREAISAREPSHQKVHQRPIFKAKQEDLLSVQQDMFNQMRRNNTEKNAQAMKQPPNPWSA